MREIDVLKKVSLRDYFKSVSARKVEVDRLMADNKHQFDTKQTNLKSQLAKIQEDFKAGEKEIDAELITELKRDGNAYALMNEAFPKHFPKSGKPSQKVKKEIKVEAEA